MHKDITPKYVSKLLRDKAKGNLLSYSMTDESLRFKEGTPEEIKTQTQELFEHILKHPTKYKVRVKEALAALTSNKDFINWFYSLAVEYQILLEEEINNSDNFWNRNIVSKIIEANRPNKNSREIWNNILRQYNIPFTFQ